MDKNALFELIKKLSAASEDSGTKLQQNTLKSEPQPKNGSADNNNINFPFQNAATKTANSRSFFAEKNSPNEKNTFFNKNLSNKIPQPNKTPPSKEAIIEMINRHDKLSAEINKNIINKNHSSEKKPKQSQQPEK